MTGRCGVAPASALHPTKVNAKESVLTSTEQPPETTGPDARDVRRGTTPWLSLVLVAGVGAGLWWYGADYYLTPVASRPDHPQHDILNATGSLGHPLGWAGIAMLLLLLGYSIRKRVSWLQPLGALGHWLSAHVFLGLMGPLLITFHCGFKVEGLVSISYWSMIITMLSGVFGRYIYVQIPSSVIGGRQSLATLTREADDLTQGLRQLLGARADDLLADEVSWRRDVSGWQAISILLLDDLRRPLLRWRLRRRLRTETDPNRRPGRGEVRRIMALMEQRRLLHRRTAAAEAMERIFHYWHVLHRPFVYIMFLIAAVHVGVAWWLGYTGW